MPALREIIVAMDSWFNPEWAESWDAVGLVCGDPEAEVRRILLAVDPVPDTIGEATGADATDDGAQLLITHHPLLLTGVHGVPADDPKGGLVHRMIRAGVAHFVAHTNADAARPGVSDSLAARLGVRDAVALRAQSDPAFDKLVVFVPAAAAQRVLDAVAAAGAGRYGSYDRCAWATPGTGTFRPLAGARPTIGAVGRIEEVAETRLEVVVPAGRRRDVVAALRAAHPYEEPAFDLLVQAPLPSGRGTGRVGALAEPTTLREFTARVAATLPATVWGVRAAGDPERRIERVAVCGGSGGGYAEDARRAGADVYVTADLKHHATLEATAELGPGAMALVDAAHWATEAPWLDQVAGQLREAFDVDVRVSRRVTDPWTLHAPSTKPQPEASP